MKTIFLGTPAFAVPTLDAMVAVGHEVLSVYTQPDRPKGRGQELAQSPVKEAALRLGLEVTQPEKVRQQEVVDTLRAAAPEVMVVVGYGQIIPQNIIDIPRFGIVNVHASLLPKYRGAAPIQWAIANGECETGVTTMQINAGLDTGDMLLKAATPIGPNENAVELSERLAQMGAQLLIETLQSLAAGTVQPEPQRDEEATLAPILNKEDGCVDWAWRAEKIHNRTRGFFAWPGTQAIFRGQMVRLWRTEVLDESCTARPGLILGSKGPLRVACGEGTVLELKELQLEGKKRGSGVDFRNGLRVGENDGFE
ncbi:MAG: methionyl-tRNA formyltransferase [Bryobacter sp.]|nr:methionyl-tRNA formyltransferase [Bryobacter sp.]